MASTPTNEEPGFEVDVNELPDTDQGAENRLEDEPLAEDGKSNALDEAQEQASEERKEGGYQ